MNKTSVRNSGFLVIAILSLVVALFLGPEKTEAEPSDFSTERTWDNLSDQGLIDIAESMYDLNSANDETVYHQMVTNGWHTNDLLSINIRATMGVLEQLEVLVDSNNAVIDQLTKSEATDNRPTYLLSLLVIAVAWGAVIKPSGSVLEEEEEEDSTGRTNLLRTD